MVEIFRLERLTDTDLGASALVSDGVVQANHTQAQGREGDAQAHTGIQEDLVFVEVAGTPGVTSVSKNRSAQELDVSDGETVLGVGHQEASSEELVLLVAAQRVRTASVEVLGDRSVAGHLTGPATHARLARLSSGQACRLGVLEEVRHRHG